MQDSIVNRLKKYYAQLSELGKAAVIIVMTLSTIILAAGEPVLFIPLIFIILVVNLLRVLWNKFSFKYLNNPRHSKNVDRTNTFETDNYRKKNEVQDNSTYEKDNWEGSFWEVQSPQPGTAKLCIDYEDGTGQKTKRVIDVKQYGSAYYGNIIMGYCQMRNAHRTFRVDRIKHCVDVDTGEIVNDVLAHIHEKYLESPKFQRDKLLENEYDTLRILLYIGKADGQLRREEKVIIRETCRALAKDSRITDEMIDEIFSWLEVPTLHAFKLAVNRFAKKGQSACDQILKATEEMIATQKTVHPSEAEAMEYIKKKFVTLL